jgi:25S rRNA (uracil2634-N3)-methyltransferase
MAQYPDAAEFENDVQALGGEVQHGIDATQLHKCAELVEKCPWDAVVFNFPHVGFGIKDQLKNIRANQEMLKGFLASAAEMVHDTGEVHITIKKGEPYDSWKVVKLGLEIPGLKLKTAFDFVTGQYPKYRHRRTLGYEAGISGKQNEDIGAGGKTYVFTKGANQPAGGGAGNTTANAGKKRKEVPAKVGGEGAPESKKKRSGKRERQNR